MTTKKSGRPKWATRVIIIIAVFCAVVITGKCTMAVVVGGIASIVKLQSPTPSANTGWVVVSYGDDDQQIGRSCALKFGKGDTPSCIALFQGDSIGKVFPLEKEYFLKGGRGTIQSFEKNSDRHFSWHWRKDTGDWRGWSELFQHDCMISASLAERARKTCK